MTDEELQKIGEIVRQQLAPMQQRLDAMDERLGGMDKRFDGIDKRLDEQGKDIKMLREDIQRVDMKVELVNERVNKVNETLEISIKDNAEFFQEVGTFIDKTKKEIMERVEGIEKHLNFPKPKN